MPGTARQAAWAFALMGLTAISSPVSQLSLTPVYGSIPSSLYHSRIAVAALVTGWTAKEFIKGRVPKEAASYLPVYAFFIPFIQFYLFKYSDHLGPKYGPLVTELLTFFPLAALSVFYAAVTLDEIDLSSLGEIVQIAGPAMASYTAFAIARSFMMGLIAQGVGTGFFFTRTGLQLAVAVNYASLYPSKNLLYAALPLMHFATLNVHVPLQRTTASLNSTLHMHNYSLIARQESLTGYISVLESTADQFWVMRCDHSILGGEWLLQSNYESRLREPIYAAFTMLEAVRLVETSPETSDPTVSDAESKALVVGLGVGTTPSALIAHGINTTIVEIDPVVYDFALRYFNLPMNHTSVLEDAVTFVARAQSAEHMQGSYDYIIHDVFTGGAEPVALFTYEFIEGLSQLLKPHGTIAINYAGDLLLPAARAVVHTIKSIFPQCQLFRENPPPDPSSSSGSDGQDFTNMIIYCRKSNEPFFFRQPVESDFLGSRARRRFLLPRHSVAADYFEGSGKGKLPKIVRKGETGVLERLQRESAVGHWGIMRLVLPGIVWENW